MRERDENYFESLPMQYQMDFELIVEIIKILGKTLKSNREFPFCIHNKIYNVVKTDEEVIITCSDGRKLTIDFCLDDHIDWDDIDERKERYATTSIRAKITDDSEFAFTNQFKWMKDYDAVDNLDEKELLRDIDILYVIDNKYRSIVLNYVGNNKVCMFGTDEAFLEFDEDGIHTYDGFLISKDFTEIVSYQGKSVPTKKELYEKKQKDRTSLNYIQDQLIEQYEEWLPIYREIVDFRKSIMDGSLNNYMFTSDELEQVVKTLIAHFKNRLIDYEEEQKNKAERKIKSLIKTLSPQELDLLRKEINKK